MNRLPIALAVVLLLSIITIGAAHAACEWPERVSHSDSECLSAEWKNQSPFPTPISKNWVTAQSSCSDLGRVVAKIDLARAPDRTWHLHDNDLRRGETLFKIRGVYCCRDLGVCQRTP